LQFLAIGKQQSGDSRSKPARKRLNYGRLAAKIMSLPRHKRGLRLPTTLGLIIIHLVCTAMTFIWSQ